VSKILVLSDQPVLRQGLAHVLERQGFEIAHGGVKPDLILLDITAGLTIGSVSDVRARIPECPVVLWSDTLPLDYVFRTLEMGVRGIVQRTAQPDSLGSTLKKVAGGEMQIGFGPGNQSAQLRRQVSLTPRERELVGRLRNGLRNKQIAAEMNITEGTVKIYLFRLFHKMGVRTRFELARCVTDQAVN
jgi:DNA-binding NarL/FixJ family response regulator